MIKSRMMIWAGNVVCIGKMTNEHSLVGKPERRRPLRDLDIEWDIK
jgi:hypothetical protein